MDLSSYSSKGIFLFPSGVGIPTPQMEGTLKVEGEETFQALIDSIPAGESSYPDAGFELKIIKEVFELFESAGTTPYLFFRYNLRNNPNITIVMKDFLEDTITTISNKHKYKNINDGRKISAKLFAEICAMPLEESQHVTRHNKETLKKRSDLRLPTVSFSKFLSDWVSLEGGAYDLLWTARALFGHAK